MLKTTVLCRSTELSKSETALTLILILEKEAPSGLMWRQIRSDQLPVTMGQGSIWFPISDSNVNTLTMSKTSVLEMGRQVNLSRSLPIPCKATVVSYGTSQGL